MRLFPSEKGLVNFFYKESDGKYFRLSRSYSLSYNYPSAIETQKQPQYVNGWTGCVPRQQKQAVHDLTVGHGLLTTALEECLW